MTKNVTKSTACAFVCKNQPHYIVHFSFFTVKRGIVRCLSDGSMKRKIRNHAELAFVGFNLVFILSDWNSGLFPIQVLFVFV